MALGVDVRLPTGDEMNLLGTGAAGIQPFVILSTHVSARVAARERELPVERVERSGRQSGDRRIGELSRSGRPTRWAPTSRANGHLTLAFDLLGRYLIDAERIFPQDFHALDGKSVFRTSGFSQESFNELERLVRLQGQRRRSAAPRREPAVRARLTHGVRDKVTPLIGFEYSF